MSSRDPGACPDGPDEAQEYGLALKTMFDEHGQGMTRKRLGELTHTSEAAVSRYLAGKRIAPEAFLKEFLAVLEARGAHVPERVRRDLHQKRQAAQEAAKRSFTAQNAHLSERVDKLIKEIEEAEKLHRREYAWLIIKSRRDNAKNGKARARIIHQLREVNAENQRLREKLASATVYVKEVEADLEHGFDRISQLTVQVEMLTKEVRDLRARTAPVPGAGSRSAPALKRHRRKVLLLFTRVSLLLITSQLTALGVVVLLVGPVASDGIKPTWMEWPTLTCGCVAVALFIHTRIRAGRKDWTSSAGRVLVTTLVPMLAAGLVAWASSLPKYSFDTQQLPATVSHCEVYAGGNGMWGNSGYTECTFTWTFNGKSYTAQDQYDKDARTVVTIDPRHPEDMHPHTSILFKFLFGAIALVAAVLGILWLALFVITLGGLVDEWGQRSRHPKEPLREPDLVWM